MGDGSPRRVARPQRRYMPSRKEHADASSRLLSKIDSLYAEARDRLAARCGPATLSRFLDAGVCIGLIDPVSNIMANTICASDHWPDHGGGKAPCAVVDENLAEMGRRSLRGLIAFLIYFFPYLAEWEAVRYLLLADADLLAAARLIVADRGMMAVFSLNSPASAPAFEAALTLAAQVAKHPQPKFLLHVWMSLSSRLHQAISLLSLQSLEALKAMVDDPVVPNLAMSWDLAATRPVYSNSIANMPYQHTRSLQMVLLDTIHGFYLRALGMLPRGELRSQLHRSLLRAGYCYGPMDPVSNIINNTIWYHTNFPAAKTPVLDVIGPNSLTRLESRSFYGLVSFVQTRYHDLSDHQAVQFLIAALCHLSDHKLMTLEAEYEHRHHCSNCNNLIRRIGSTYDDVIRKVVQKNPCSNLQVAYVAAATAAWHPNPEEQAKFLTSWKVHPVMDQLTSEDVHRWSYFLSPEQPPTPERICESSYPVKAGKMRSEAQQRRISRKVKAALNKHLLQDGKPTYDLHIISCVNENVCGPEYCDDIADSLSFAPYKYRYSHVNFLATPKGSLSCASNPILFFAEFDNEKEDSAPLLCCPVDKPTPFAEHVRCLYCEATGARVVHPTSKEFHGGGSEFEKVIRGEHSLTNARLICKNDYAVQRMCTVEEDFMYVDVK
ncbi:unnamed protein product [Urochloa decumbens]|uniref:Uncharacterized protein n=1 Tax=Urochloa decumbens TaxID=240449 RepID=A0ABC9B6U9_9POAL